MLRSAFAQRRHAAHSGMGPSNAIGATLQDLYGEQIYGMELPDRLASLLEQLDDAEEDRYSATSENN